MEPLAGALVASEMPHDEGFGRRREASPRSSAKCLGSPSDTERCAAHGWMATFGRDAWTVRRTHAS
jgi:hypothetical protein